MTLRGRLLPLVSLRALLGLPTDSHRQDRGKIIVLSLGNSVVGLVADRTREILRVDPGMIDPAPALLTRGAGDAEITSICRLDGGKRLVAILSPDRLFRSDLMRRVLSEQAGGSNDPGNQTEANAMADEQFIVFRLGDQEYGLPIAAVHEIARPPEHITRLPRAPEFIDGVMNLRGIVVPIIDLRRKFGLEPRERGSSQRILVLGIDSVRTGFLVDGVSEVMKTATDAIGSAPELSPAQMRLIGRIVTLGAQDRMILLIDPAHLLDQVEADVLAKFDRSGLEQASRAS
jgi:purine-binding chemotaxis protein CheW